MYIYKNYYSFFELVQLRIIICSNCFYHFLLESSDQGLIFFNCYIIVLGLLYGT